MRNNIMSAAYVVPALNKWFRKQGVRYDTTRISLQSCPSSGGATLGVFALQDIAVGDLLCTIPKTAILSVRTTGAADLLEQHHLGGGLGLIVAILYELGLGKASSWHSYLQSLPSRVYLPIFWTPAELAELQGTELHLQPPRDRELAQQDYETEVLPLLAACHERLDPLAFSLDKFLIAASWVGSRGFGVDRWHGVSMVPLADIFNHKAAFVSLAGGFVVEGESSISGDDDGGEELASDHSGEESEGKDSSGCDSKGQCMAKDDGKDSANGHHSLPIPSTLRLITTAGGDDSLQMDIGICGAEVDGTEVLNIVAASAVCAGCEVHNTYGELGNSDLVSKYGFALRHNPFGCVHLQKQEVLRLAKDHLGATGFQNRHAFLQDHSMLLDEEEEPFQVLPNGGLGPALLVALRVLFASPSDYSSWKSISDAVPSLSGVSQKNGTNAADAAHASFGEAHDGGNSDAATEDGQVDAELGNTSIPDAAGVLGTAACAALLTALRRRLSQYRRQTLEEDEQELSQVAADGSEASAARRAALLLVISEKEILHSAMTALEAFAAEGIERRRKRCSAESVDQRHSKRMTKQSS